MVTEGEINFFRGDNRVDINLNSNTPRIAILSSEVVDQIAAGEVVERPAHLVKELVENSLDAGSTEISIEFSDGGRKVTVTDNGCGILSQDLVKALSRHATSKITKSEDLWDLHSFGFRGEALSSIAAVSRLKLSSKSKEASEGAQVINDFGVINFTDGIGHSQGTRVEISDLFGNVPARLKFLRSPAAESTQIKTVIKALALANPQVSFRVTQGGELLHLWSRTSDRWQRASQILEIKKIYEGFAQRGEVKTYSLFAGPSEVAKNYKQMWFFVQNRWVQDRGIQAAVMEAYRHLLMHGEYPQVISWVDLTPSLVDINVHPTKSQVKFADPSLVFRAVHASVRDVLEQAPWLFKEQKISDVVSVVADKAEIRNLDVRSPQKPLFEKEPFLRTQFKQKDFFPSKERESFSKESLSSLKVAPEFENYWSSLQVLSQVNLTYIVTQSRDAVIFVDQHAAHERVLFERIMAMWRGVNKVEVQEFLFPLAVDLSQDLLQVLLQSSEELKKIGVEVEALGPATLGVRAAPVWLKEASFGEALEKMAHGILDHGGSHQMELLMGEVSATMACHSAIRAGQALTMDEMRSLLEQMDEFPLSSFCPHGRPVSVEYPFFQLEKDFGRTQ